MAFFGCDPNQRIEGLLLSSVINLVCFPIDYSPFYDTQILQEQNVDFKFKQISTQASITIFKAGQMIDSLIMLTIVKVYNLISQNNEYIQNYYNLILICFIFNIALQSYHIIDRYLSFKNKSYKYFFKNRISLEELQIILKNSKKIKYLCIDSVDSIEILKNLANDFKQKKDIFDMLMSINDDERQIIDINRSFFLKCQRKITLDSNYFFNEILHYLQNESNIKTIALINLSKHQSLQIQQTLIERLFKYGIDKNLISFFSSQIIDEFNFIHKFEVEMLKFLSFQNNFSLLFSTNPKFVYYDLYETDLPL